MLKLQKKGGDQVSRGTYWNVSNGERVRLEKGGLLPGDDSQTYVRFHPAALLVVGPLLGLVYAIFMPLAAILMVLWVIGQKLFSGAFAALQKAAEFGWRPGHAYLAGGGTRPQEPSSQEQAGRQPTAREKEG